jgi:integrase/recombinase XerD
MCIRINGKMTPKVYSILRDINQCLYSRTHDCFYFLYSPETLRKLTTAIENTGMPVEVSKSFEDYELRKKYSKTLITLPDAYREQLIKLRYSVATCKNYCIQFVNFLTYIYPKDADNFTDKDIHDYMLWMVQKRKIGRSLQNQAINSIKFYLEHVRQGARQVYHVDRPRKEHKLPVVLSEEDIRRLFLQATNIKHKCILMLLYSSGLRMSELLNLKLADIDTERKLINIRSGKGGKDRVTVLSHTAIEYLEIYLQVCHPVEWVFENPGGGRYSARSVDRIIKDKARRAGIIKNVSAHTLRHCFATHLLESGTDLRYIQSLLGHESSRTTERYAHVTLKGFSQLVSPLDRLSQRFNLEDNKEI